METYRDHFEVVSLHGLEQVGDSALQATANGHAVGQVVQQDGPQGIDIT